ncbi:MAG: ABC transporter permease, partial [Saprospiraceae bacterium]
MLIHYIKIAWKVLLRRKLFSFISLFGICFTLVVLMLLASLMENEFGTNAPFSNKHDIVNIRNIEQKHVEIDTIYEIDSSRIVNEKIQYDTIDFKTQEESRTTASSNFSIKVFEDYLIHLKTPLHKAIISSEDVNIYRNNKKIVLHQIFTNEEYWEIMNFKFIEGKPFNKKNVDNREKGVVITKKAKKDFFGNIGSVLGKEITYENNTYQVMGLVENSNSTYRLTHADIFIPYTLLPKIILEDKDNMGPFSMVTLAKNKGDIENIKQEVTKLSKMVEPVSHPLSKYPFNQVKLNTNTYTEGYAMSLFNSENENNVRNLFLILLAATLLFILIPTINLININVSRIAERSSEIGTRKAFG